jgi:hypothetical protein
MPEDEPRLIVVTSLNIRVRGFHTSTLCPSPLRAMCKIAQSFPDQVSSMDAAT